MAIKDKAYKHEINIKDNTFDIDAMNNYRLYILLGENSLQICVADSIQNRCLILEDYRFYSLPQTDALIASLNRIYDNSLFLKANFWQNITIIVKNNPFTLVPRELFQANQSEKYLQYITEVGQEMQILHAPQASAEAINVFVMESKLYEWFKQTYPNRTLNFLHPTTTFIEGIKKQIPIVKRPRGEYQAHIYVNVSYLIITVWKDGNLEFCNTFRYQTSQDFAYFVLFVLDELRLNRETCKVRLYGSIQPISEVFRILNTYISDLLIWSEKPNWLAFSHDFDEVTQHFYFNLYSTHLCR